MKTLLAAVVAFVSLTLVVPDADARRFGGGRSLGMQRSAPPPQKTAPAPQPQQPAAAPAQQPTGPKWLGPLAGFALGAGLFALFLNNGWAGLLAGFLVIGLLAAASVYAARMLRSRLGHPALRYEAAGSQLPAHTLIPADGGTQAPAAAPGSWPAGFDAAEFVRHARLNFVRLQQAHDRQDLSAIRDFLTPEVYREIEADIRAAGDARQHTEVLTLEAQVLEVAEEKDSYVVSVRFSGMIREEPGAEAARFSEIWHLQKPVGGGSGWLVAGIQQSYA